MLPIAENKSHNCVPTSLFGQNSGFDHLLPNMSAGLQPFYFGTGECKKEQKGPKNHQVQTGALENYPGSMCFCNDDTSPFSQYHEFAMHWESRRLSLLVIAVFSGSRSSNLVSLRPTEKHSTSCTHKFN